jgi:hypothetical protein
LIENNQRIPYRAPRNTEKKRTFLKPFISRCPNRSPDVINDARILKAARLRTALPSAIRTTIVYTARFNVASNQSGKTMAKLMIPHRRMRARSRNKPLRARVYPRRTRSARIIRRFDGRRFEMDYSF